jgi:hypothetical protein
LRRDLAVERRRQAIDDPALDLALDDLGLTVMPQSMAATTRCTFTAPSALTETSATSAT